jgi:hypothetical protein
MPERIWMLPPLVSLAPAEKSSEPALPEAEDPVPSIMSPLSPSVFEDDEMAMKVLLI